MREILGAFELPPPTAPMAVARVFVERRYLAAKELLTLRHWRGGWWSWQTDRWVELEQRALAAAAYTFTEHAFYVAEDTIKPWSPNRHRIADLLDALAAVVHLPESVSMPSWLDGRGYDGLLVSISNGLLDVGTKQLLSHTPLFWNTRACRSPYEPGCPTPSRWHTFLGDALARRRRVTGGAAGMVRLHDLRPARPAQDPVWSSARPAPARASPPGS